jgi:hypothetical protein
MKLTYYEQRRRSSLGLHKRNLSHVTITMCKIAVMEELQRTWMIWFEEGSWGHVHVILGGQLIAKDQGWGLNTIESWSISSYTCSVARIAAELSRGPWFGKMLLDHWFRAKDDGLRFRVWSSTACTRC